MIDVSRMTDAEIDVLTDALISYRASIEAVTQGTRNTATCDACTWRHHMTNEILDALTNR